MRYSDRNGIDRWRRFVRNATSIETSTQKRGSSSRVVYTVKVAWSVKAGVDEVGNDIAADLTRMGCTLETQGAYMHGVEGFGQVKNPNHIFRLLTNEISPEDVQYFHRAGLGPRSIEKMVWYAVNGISGRTYSYYVRSGVHPDSIIETHETWYQRVGPALNAIGMVDRDIVKVVSEVSTHFSHLSDFAAFTKIFRTFVQDLAGTPGKTKWVRVPKIDVDAEELHALLQAAAAIAE